MVILPNSKYIYFNNNTYQPNLLRLLTQTDYSTLNSSINSVRSSLTTQINNAKPIYTKITRSYTSSYENTIYTMPSNVKTVIAWGSSDVTDDNYINVKFGSDDGNNGVIITNKDYRDTRSSYGIGIMVDGIAVSINGDAGSSSWSSFGRNIYTNNIYVNVVLDSGARASIDVSILAFT